MGVQHRGLGGNRDAHRRWRIKNTFNGECLRCPENSGQKLGEDYE